MAELHVQRKDPSIWPGVLAGLVVLALILWFVFGRGDEQVGRLADQADSTFESSPMTERQGTGTRQGMAAGQLDGMSAPVAQFLQFGEHGSGADASHAHAYEANGLRQITVALRDVAGTEVGGVPIQPRMAEIQQRADELERYPASAEHALMTRDAFLMAAGLMGQMQPEGDTAAGAPVHAVMTAARATRLPAELRAA